MSFLKKLFGGQDGGGKAPKGDAVGGEDSYKGFAIKALLVPNGSEFQLSGLIEKDIDGVPMSHRFVRADRLGSRDDAVMLSLVKARQIIDEQGDKVFSSSWPKPN